MSNALITLTLTNRVLKIEGAQLDVLRAIDRATSYLIAGHKFMKAFREHRWDGKAHLFKLNRKKGYTVPSGLTRDVIQVLRESDREFQVIDETHVRAKRRTIEWNRDLTLRPYQMEAVRALLLAKPVPAHGVLKMPVRSGKTKTAARIIAALGLPTLFIVPSRMLLHQTIRALKEALPKTPIGTVGDGRYDMQFVTVATIQTLDAMRGRRGRPARGGRSAVSAKPQDPRYKALMALFDVVIVDEVHHFTGEGDWYEVLRDIDARYKVGLSATVFPESEREIERGIMWVRATIGPVVHEVPVTRLVEEGYLMRQRVLMYRVTKPRALARERWSQTLKKAAIEENAFRNELIVRVTAEQVEAGSKVLIVANRLNHIARLTDLMDDAGLDYRVIVGKDDSESRASKLEAFESGDCSVLIGTVLGEGVDIPCANCVINAEGGASDIQTIQRQRNLTIAEGKRAAVFVDFYDAMNGYFEKHSRARLEAYRAEESYDVKLLKAV